uniref:Uncharacterized protein n=1 Tax=Pseudonaja textilis TaxID=8673 RepID=A0A670YYT3_PSETE
MDMLFGFLLVVCVLIISQRGKGVDLGEWKRNTLIQDMEKLANLQNKTDCWVCMHMPTHKTSGLPMVAVPLAEGDWYKGQCCGCLGTWSSSWTTSNINTLHLGSRIQEVAGICWTHNETVENMTYLGTYPFCNKTIVTGNGSRVYSGDMKTKNLTYFVHNISYFDIISLINENGYPYIPATCCPTTKENQLPKCANGNNAPSSTYLAMLMEFFVKLIYAEPNKVGHLLGANLWLLCGRMAYDRMPARWKGVCTFGKVIPSHVILKSLGTAHIRNAHSATEVNSVLTHDYWTQVSRGVIPPLGVMMNYRDLHHLNNWTVTMFKDTIKTLKLLEEEQGKILDFVLQTRYAVDTILAAQGGVCAVVHTHCCMYISDYSPNITATIQHMERTLKENPLQSEGEGLDVWSALWSWLPDGSWIRHLIVGVILLIVFSLCECCCIQCHPGLLGMCRVKPTEGELLLQMAKSY